MPLTPLKPIAIDAFESGNTGTPYVWRFESGHAGSDVLISAILHGNEICGAHALAALLRGEVAPRRGALTLVFANPGAYLADGGPRRFVDEDMNRVWSDGLLDRDDLSGVEAQRARALRPFLRRADILLDLHSMSQPSEPMILCGTAEKTERFAAGLGLEINLMVDRGHVSGVRMRDYGAFSDPDSPKVALLLECGLHNVRGSEQVALWACIKLLDRLGMISNAQSRWLTPRPMFLSDAADVIDVTDAVVPSSPDFRFTEPIDGTTVIRRCGTVVAVDDGRPIVTPYDNCMMIMPAPGARPGQTAVRFGKVRRG